MSLNTKLQKITLDLEELIEDVSDTEKANQLEEIKLNLQQIYLFEVD